MNFIIFFSIVFTVYGLVNYYLLRRGLSALPGSPAARGIFIALFLLLALSFLAGRFLERASIGWFSTALVWIGSFWLGAMTYFFLIALLVDLARLVDHFIPWFPSAIAANAPRARFLLLCVSAGVVLAAVIAGFFNARHPRLREIDIPIGKKSPMKSLTAAVVSDIHLGTIVSNSRLTRIVSMINGMKPDLVLLPGDVVDEDLAPVIRDNLGEVLRQIRAPLGVYAVTGNHEYIGGAEAACAYLREHGVTMLRDSAARIADAFTLVGREDRSGRAFGGAPRKPLAELMAGVDMNLPVILMDHQPLRLEEASDAGVDLQLSGHTHHGQLWPFNYITEKVYEVSWGYLRKGGTQYYVSCGAGTWGPPIRTGNRPEVVRLKLTFGS